MSDEEIVKAIAEKVMGWEEVTHHLSIGMAEFAAGRQFYVAKENGKVHWKKAFNWFNPLTSDSDACAVLEKMADCSTDFELQFHSAWGVVGGWAVHVENNELDFIVGDQFPYFVEGSGRRRAICLAALKAVKP